MTFKEELSILINTFRLFRLAMMYESLGDKVDVRDEEEDDDKADDEEEEEEEEDGKIPELMVVEVAAEQPEDPRFCSKAWIAGCGAVLSSERIPLADDCEKMPAPADGACTPLCVSEETPQMP